MGHIFEGRERPEEASHSLWQRTLRDSIHCSGVGLHSGKRVSLSLHPAAPDTGIVFRRIDLDGHPEIPALYDRVGDTRLCTTLVAESGANVGTVEHLMSAFVGCGVDNAIVELNATEVPIMDGSAEPFVFLIECAGLVVQSARRHVVEVLKTVEVREGDKVARLDPADGFSIDLGIAFGSSAIGEQNLFVDVTSRAFKDEISRARTFGFLHEVEALRAAGLARGGSLENAVVVAGDQVLNEDGLRYADEFVRHKILDCIGDLSLAGHGLMAHFSGYCVGHRINNLLLRALFADAEAWRLRPAPSAVGRINPHLHHTPAAISA